MRQVASVRWDELSAFWSDHLFKSLIVSEGKGIICTHGHSLGSFVIPKTVLYSGAVAARRGDQQGECSSSKYSLNVWTLRAARHLLFLMYQLAPALSSPCLLLLLWTLWCTLAQDSLFYNEGECWEGTKDSVPEAEMFSLYDVNL